MKQHHARFTHLYFTIILAVITIGAGCDITDETSSNTNQPNTGNVVCDETYFMRELDTFSATQFAIEPLSTIVDHPYRENGVCQYLGYIQEDDVNNLTVIGIIDDPTKNFFSNALEGAKVNERWVEDESSTAAAESFFVELLPISLSSNLSTWNLYTYKNGITYAIEGVIQNNNHTPQETKGFMRSLMQKLVTTLY